MKVQRMENLCIPLFFDEVDEWTKVLYLMIISGVNITSPACAHLLLFLSLLGGEDISMNIQYVSSM